MAKWLDKYEQGGLVLKKKTKDNYGKKPNVNDVQASAGPGFVGEGYNVKGRDYSPAWGGQFQDGGSIPTDKKSQKFYNTLKDYYSASDRTEAEKAQYAAFQRLNEAHGYAPVGVKNKTIMGKRSMINPFSGRLNLVADADPEVGEIKSTPQKLMDQYIGEYSHYQQYNQNPEESKLKKTGRFLGHMAKDFGQMFKNTKGLNFGEAYNKNYVTPGTTEYEAHQVIQPKLQNEFANYYGQEWTKNRNRLQMGGALPGAVGFSYARTQDPAPANGKYTKKTKASAQNGTEMKFYQEGLDFKPKSISKNGSVIKDDRGQWAHPGEVTEIGSPDITMQGVDYPVLGISDTGDTKMMYPDQDYKFDGDKVTEFPMMEKGGWLDKFDDKAQKGKSYVSMKNNKDWFDSHANWSNTGNKQYDDLVRKSVLSGRFGVDPNTGDLIKLKESEWTDVSDMEKTLAKDKRNWTKKEKQEAGDLFNSMTPEGKQFRKDVVAGNMQAMFQNPLFYAPAAIAAAPFVAGAASAAAPILGAAMEAPMFGVAGLTGTNSMNAYFAYQAAKNLPNVASSIKTAYQNPTLGNLGNAALETGLTTLDALPFASSVAPEVKAGMNAFKGTRNLSTELPIDDLIGTAVDKIAKPTNVKTSWQAQELPGLHLSSTMEGGPISKIIEPKTGLINLDQALTIIGKESGGATKVDIIKKALGKDIPKKIDYNDFRKTVQDQLIPLDKEIISTSRSGYNIDKLGYTQTTGAFGRKPKDILNDIENTKERLFNMEQQGNPLGEKWTENLRKTLKGFVEEYDNMPLENQTIRLGNKNKFGRGTSSEVHTNPEETLGHAHFLRDAETPDVLTVTQIQSDAFQGTHRAMPKSLEEAEFSLNQLENIQKTRAEMLKGFRAENNTEKIKVYEELFENQEKQNLLSRAEVENFGQKSLLDKNHQERYLQEIVDYAGKRGDINKVRVPTPETAAKVQKYYGIDTEDFIKQYRDALNVSPAELVKKVSGLPESERKLIQSVLNGERKGKIYDTNAETILKKYAEQPKVIKKVFGKEPNIITDGKGNSWYEFDIPNKFKGGKGEIKAFKDGGWLNKYK
jgi:hypothetical protein